MRAALTVTALLKQKQQVELIAGKQLAEGIKELPIDGWEVPALIRIAGQHQRVHWELT
jgi:hypothetical protein